MTHELHGKRGFSEQRELAIVGSFTRCDRHARIRHAWDCNYGMLERSYAVRARSEVRGGKNRSWTRR